MIWWIVGAFVAGELAGLALAAIVSGKMDDYAEWRKRKNEKKNIQNFYMRDGGDHRGADRDEHQAGGKT